MAVNDEDVMEDTKQNGLTLIELTLIVTLFLTMTLITLGSMSEINSRTERAQFERTVQHIQNAINIEFSLKSKEPNFDQFIHHITEQNPITFLQRAPKNYLGSYANIDPFQVESGSWYFDSHNHLLIYVPHHLYSLNSHDKVLTHIAFQIKPKFDDQNQNELFDPTEEVATGLIMESIEPYNWEPIKASFDK